MIWFMMAQIACPRCNHMVDLRSRQCTHCGVDLALAAVLLEQSYNSTSSVPKAPEELVPRLGESLIDKKLLTLEELQKALNYQKAQSIAGEHCLIGQALLDLHLINRSTLDAVVTEQILQLQSALQKANLLLEQRVQERTIDLQRALNKLTELNQLKSNFISNISHELRTPLTHIKGYLNIMGDGTLGPLTTQQTDAVLVLQNAEARLERLIEDLIQFSLAARGELSINVASFTLCNLVMTAVSQASAKAQANQISLHASVPEQLPDVRADKDRIGWVLDQLIDNAIKFSPPSGQVTVSAHSEGDSVNIMVSDTGIGIPKECIQEIFEPFHQLDGSMTRRYSGTGIGLALVQRILEAHNSHIKVSSSPGKGSIFMFSIPVDQNDHA